MRAPQVWNDFGLTGEGVVVGIIDTGCCIAHPDLATSGGIMETKRIADYCRDAGIGIALHQAGSPVVAMANAHFAMAMENFIALEMHSVDNRPRPAPPGRVSPARQHASAGS